MLYDDIQKNESGYFIGALIFIKATQGDHGEQKYEVVAHAPSMRRL